MIPQYKECAPCAAKPGSPTLCAACLHNRTVIDRLVAAQKESKPNKQFRISRLSVNRIAVDTEPSKGNHVEGHQDVVVTLIDKDGSRFEVQRITVHDTDLFVGSDTSVADLVCRRSWGGEGKDKDDPSVSCPLCLFQGHGAGVCKERS